MVRVLVIVALLSLARAAQWAVLVAGSAGYENYRHQSDTCHIYHLLIAQGVPASNIIVFSYNDVATLPSNPFPGELYNAPGSSPTNVYAGCVVDYQGNDNNSTNFLAVLAGDEAAVKGVGSGRVLKSDIWDTVFISFVDHGASGFIAFPNDYLYADTLVATLKDMKEKWKFRHLVFFLDACDSGSIFDEVLPSDISVYAVTAASPTQYSWGTFCPADDVVRDTGMNTCLGDLFTVSWMDAVATSDHSTFTLSDLFTEVSALTNMSTPMQFGDLSIASELASAFLGSKSSPGHWPAATESGVGWSARDAKYQSLAHAYLLAPTTANAYAVMDELSSRVEVTAIFSELMNALSPVNPAHLLEDARAVTNFQCLRTAVAGYEEQCGRLSEFGLGFVNVLKNACEEGMSADSIVSEIASICSGDIVVEKRRKSRRSPLDYDDYDESASEPDYADYDEVDYDEESDFFAEEEDSGWFSFWGWIIGY